MNNFVKKRWVLSLLITGGVAACAAKDPALSKDFIDLPLSGRINGKAWKVRYAYVDPTIKTPEEDDYVFVFLDTKPKDRCPKDDDAAARTIMVSAPKDPKTTKLKRGSSRTLVFHYVAKGSPVAFSAPAGKIKVDSAASHQITGHLIGNVNTDNYINGTFTAEICELGDMDKASPWE